MPVFLLTVLGRPCWLYIDTLEMANPEVGFGDVPFWSEPFVKPQHLRNDFDVFLAMEDIINDFVEDNFLRNKTHQRRDSWSASQ